ncbi:MAG: hypothetical protein K8F90_12330 [Hyphomicrobiales bacterium]|nr:hypothetical protein [Hyphomicrobiales bacterium]
MTTALRLAAGILDRIAPKSALGEFFPGPLRTAIAAYVIVVLAVTFNTIAKALRRKA